MPRSTVTVCLEPGCPNLRPCPVDGHDRGAWHGSNRRAELPRNWETIRRRVLKRDGNRCTHVELGRRCYQQATDVHHLGAPDDHRLEQLASLCADHHRAETAADAAAARRRARSG